MADYKELISGKLKNLAGKVKSAAESAGVGELYAKGVERTKSYGSIAKLSLGLSGDNEKLKSVYQQIGKLYYENSKDNPEDFCTSLFAQAKALSESIDEKRRAIEALKAGTVSSSESDIEVEITELEDEGSAGSEDAAVSEPEAAADTEFEDVVNSTESDGTGEE